MLKRTIALWSLTGIFFAPIARFLLELTIGIAIMWSGAQLSDWSTVIGGASMTATGAAFCGLILALGQIVSLNGLSVSKTAWTISTVVGCAGAGLIVYFTWRLLAANPYPTYFDFAAAQFTAYMALSGILQGAVIGVLQWLVLRRSYPASSLWIVATAIGWCMFFALPVVGHSAAKLHTVMPNATSTIWDGAVFLTASFMYVGSTVVALYRIGTVNPDP